MSHERNKLKDPFLSFLQNYQRIAMSDSVDLEEVCKAFDEDPLLFHEKWLHPLFAAGLNMDRACEMVLQSIFRPN